MLERLHLTDFKSFRDESVGLAPLTFLVGANASGKSNFFDAIVFLQQIAREAPFAVILDGDKRSPAEWPGIRGGSREAARLGTSVFEIVSTWKVMDATEVTHAIACRVPEGQLEFESLGRGPAADTLFRTGAGSPETVEVPWPVEHGRGQPQSPPPTLVTRDLSVLWQILDSRGPSSLVVPGDVLDAAQGIEYAFERIRSLTPRPTVMRGYGRRGGPLGEDGRNISGALADLCNDGEAQRSVIEWLVELLAPELDDLDFIDVPEIGDVMAVLVEKGGKRITARSLSDGTLRFLGLLVGLRTAPAGSVVLIEDIEADLHPTRIGLLVEYLETVARENKVQIIASTHSPVVLRWLKDKTLENVVVFGRAPDREGTLMRRLGDIPEFSKVVQRTGIDELFSTGWLERAL